MEKLITAFSIEQAFVQLAISQKIAQNKIRTKEFLNLDDILSTTDREADIERFKELFEGRGKIIGYTLVPAAENPNLITYQTLNNVIEGDKKWSNIYLAIYDTPFNDLVVPDSSSLTKKECVSKARIACANEKRDIFVILGKKAVDFSRCSTSIIYKPAPGQTPGQYCFIW